MELEFKFYEVGDMEAKNFKNLGLIVATGQNREIGYQNDLIWRIKEDLDYFRKVTMGSYIIMGRNTYESMPKNLSGRRYIVLSRDRNLVLDSKKILNRSVKESLEFIVSKKSEKFFVVGGSAIYKEFLPYINFMHITEIEQSFSLADAYFPDYDENDFTTLEDSGFMMEGNIEYRHKLLLKK